MKETGKSILIVDDSTIIVKRLELMLQAADGLGPVHTANDFAPAWQFIEARQPDIVLLDINLPGGSGIQLLRQIKDSYPFIKVVMISNQSEEHYRNTCKDLGAAWFIDKSSDFEQIPAVVSFLL